MSTIGRGWGPAVVLLLTLYIAMATAGASTSSGEVAPVLALVPYATAADRSSEAVDLTAPGAQGNIQDESKQLEGMLHWAIQHSDPNALREAAAEVERSGGSSLSGEELAERRAHTRELINFMKQPTEVDMMKECLRSLAAGDSSQEARLAALRGLQDLVAPLDNANDLKHLGMRPILDALREPALAEHAATVIGVAAANNLKFQTDLIETEPHIFGTLIEMMSHQSWGSVEKGVRCAASLVRNQAPLLKSFLEAGGAIAAQKLFTEAAAPARLRARAMELLTDLAPRDVRAREQLQCEASCHSIVSLLRQPDRDVQERAAQALLLMVKGLKGNKLHCPTAGAREALGEAEMELKFAIGQVDEGNMDELEWLESIRVLMADVQSALMPHDRSEGHIEL